MKKQGYLIDGAADYLLTHRAELKESRARLLSEYLGEFPNESRENVTKWITFARAASEEEGFWKGFSEYLEGRRVCDKEEFLNQLTFDEWQDVLTVWAGRLDDFFKTFANWQTFGASPAKVLAIGFQSYDFRERFCRAAIERANELAKQWPAMYGGEGIQ